MADMLISPGVFRAIDPVDSEAEEDVGLDGGVFSFPCMKEVSADDVLELMQGGPFAVTFDTCIAFMTSHCFDLSCFHIN